MQTKLTLRVSLCAYIFIHCEYTHICTHLCVWFRFGYLSWIPFIMVRLRLPFHSKYLFLLCIPFGRTIVFPFQSFVRSFLCFHRFDLPPQFVFNRLMTLVGARVHCLLAFPVFNLAVIRLSLLSLRVDTFDFIFCIVFVSCARFLKCFLCLCEIVVCCVCHLWPFDIITIKYENCIRWKEVCWALQQNETQTFRC